MGGADQAAPHQAEELVLRKGFSSPTRDDVSTALGAWAIKTSKPFKLDNSKMKRSRTKQRDIWATCYDKNCEFCIHFQLGEGREGKLCEQLVAAGLIWGTYNPTT